jgi:regulation of enolase protein 1 (concanavalin A-like superfamily)
MRRSILSVLLLLTPALALAVPVPRDRERELLEKHWGTPYDPDGDCSFRAERSRLFIKIPGKPHIMAAEIGQTNGPRTLRDVEGDFTAVVRVSGPFPVDPISLVEGRWAFYGAGLLIWQDEKNYIRFERACMHFPKGQWRCWPNWELRQDAKATRGWDWNDGALDEAKAVTLRVARKGETFTGAFRSDGGPWQELAPIRTQFAKKVRVGVVAAQNTAAGYEATFDDLGITLAPAPP